MAAPFTHAVVVRLGRTDAAGVLYFAEQLDLCHEAYEAMLDDAGVPVAEVLRGSWALPIVRAEADLTAPVRVGDALAIDVVVERLGTSSFVLEHRVRRGEAPVGACRTVHVCVDKQSGEKRALPEELRSALSQRAAPPAP